MYGPFLSSGLAVGLGDMGSMDWGGVGWVGGFRLQQRLLVEQVGFASWS